MHSGKSVGQLRRAAGAGDAALAVDDDAVRFKVAAGGQRREAENAGLRVATGIGDELGRDDFLAVHFRQTIDGLSEMGQVFVTGAVPLGVDVGIAEAVVGAEVNDAEAVAQQRRQGAHAGAVRQTAKNTLDAAPAIGRRETARSEGRCGGQGWGANRRRAGRRPGAR